MGNLKVSPLEVNPGSRVDIEASVTNGGDLGGAYSVELKVNGKIESTQTVTIGGNTIGSVSFSVTRDAPGSYQVSIGGLSGSFTVAAPSELPGPAVFAVKSLSLHPGVADLGQNVVISVEVQNTGGSSGPQSLSLKIDGVVVETREVTVAPRSSTTVDFTYSAKTTGVKNVNVAGTIGRFTVRPFSSASGWLANQLVAGWGLHRRRGDRGGGVLADRETAGDVGACGLAKMTGGLPEASVVPRNRIELLTRGFSVQPSLLMDMLAHLAALGHLAEELARTIAGNGCQSDHAAVAVRQLAAKTNLPSRKNSRATYRRGGSVPIARPKIGAKPV
jgi:hypothetical protein